MPPIWSRGIDSSGTHFQKKCRVCKLYKVETDFNNGISRATHRVCRSCRHRVNRYKNGEVIGVPQFIIDYVTRHNTYLCKVCQTNPISRSNMEVCQQCITELENTYIDHIQGKSITGFVTQIRKRVNNINAVINIEGGEHRLDLAYILRNFKVHCELCDTYVGIGINIDHCHRTGKLRGFLCSECNRCLGCAKDNPEVLRKMADYIEHHQRESAG